MTTLPLDESTDLALDRELRAPRERVWAALTDPTALDRWWGPSGFRTVTEAYDLRPGGAWRMTMHGPDGHAYPNHALFDVVEPPARLVLRYVDGSGDVHHVTTIRLDALDAQRTRLTLSLRFPSAAARKDAVERIGAVEGGRQTLARLAAHLEGTDRGVFRIQRLFAATPERLWALWTDADHLARWFHPSAWTITRAELDRAWAAASATPSPGRTSRRPGPSGASPRSRRRGGWRSSSRSRTRPARWRRRPSGVRGPSAWRPPCTSSGTRGSVAGPCSRWR